MTSSNSKALELWVERRNKKFKELRRLFSLGIVVARELRKEVRNA